MDAIVQVVQDWSEAKDKNNRITAIFFDFAKAFDLVNHNLLLTKLQKILPQWLIAWIAAWLSTRYQRIKIGLTTTPWLPVEAGVIQGSVLGPILFILFISDINNYIPDRCTLEKYANDILTYIIGEHDPELPQTIVNAVNQWCIDNQMKLNTAKCKVITFTPKNQAPVKDITLNNTTLEIVSQYKYLGILLSPNLDYDAQWTKVQKTIKSAPYLIQSLKKCGFRTTILVTVYNSYVLSHIIYSAPILTSCSMKAKSEMTS
jgi:hypothetical protein